MNKHSRLIVATVLCVGFLGGCAAQDAASLTEAQSQAAALAQDAGAVRNQVQARLTTMPATDPQYTRLETELNQLDAIVAKAQAYAPLVSAAVQSQTTQTIDPTLQQAIAALPYGSIALAVLSVVFALVKHVQAGQLVNQQQQTQKAFEQVVGALDAAMPEPTADQQAKVAAVLDSDVKAKIAALRSG